MMRCEEVSGQSYPRAIPYVRSQPGVVTSGVYANGRRADISMTKQETDRSALVTSYGSGCWIAATSLVYMTWLSRTRQGASDLSWSSTVTHSLHRGQNRALGEGRIAFGEIGLTILFSIYAKAASSLSISYAPGRSF
jgi:hypothetical protein